MKNLFIPLLSIIFLLASCGTTPSSQESSSSKQEETSVTPTTSSDNRDETSSGFVDSSMDEFSSIDDLDSSTSEDYSSESSIEEPSTSTHEHKATIFKKENVSQPGCDYIGSYEYVGYCECGEVVSRSYETIEPLGHIYRQTSIVEPTYYSDGFIIYTCSRCGHEAVEKYADQLEHNYETTWSIDEMAGTHYHRCIDEDYTSFRKDEEPHSFSDWKTIVPVGETNNGIFRRYCSTCGYMEEKIENSLKDEECIEHLSFTEYDDHYEVTGLIDDVEELYIPAMYNDKPVTEVSNIQSNDNIKKVHIADSVTKVDAFSYCSSIEEVYFGRRLTDIAMNSFYWCRNLKTITIFNQLRRIADLAFYYCTSLKDVYFNGTPSEWASIDICTAFGSNHDGYRLFFIDPDGSYSYNNNKYSLLEKIMIEGIVSTGNNSFAKLDQIKEVVVSEGVEMIGGGFCIYCKNLEKVTLPEKSLKIIGNEAFLGCKKLKSIDLPNSLEEIFSSAFSNSGLESITVPELLDYVPYGFVSQCFDLKEVRLPEGIKRIANYAFMDCKSLTEIDFPNSLEEIGEGAFANCDSISSLSLPDNLKTIGDRAFSYATSLKDISFNDKLETIGKYAFTHCISLRNVVLPDSLTFIDDCAFMVCSNLTSVTLGNNIDNMGDYIFDGCTSLVKLNCSKIEEYNSRFNLLSQLFTPLMEGELIEDGKFTYVDDGVNKILVGYYGDDPVVVIPDYITEIKDYALFSHRIASIVIPNDEVVINKKSLPDEGLIECIVAGEPSKVNHEGDFYYYLAEDGYHLTYYSGHDSKIVIPDFINVIDSKAFSDRFSTYLNPIKEVVFGTGVKEICSYGIEAPYLENIVLNDGLETLRSFSIVVGEKIHDIEFPASVTTLEEVAFYSDINNYLNEFVTPLGITDLYRIAGHSSDRVHKVVITDNVQTIHQYALDVYYDELIIGTGVTKIEKESIIIHNYDAVITYKGTISEFEAIEKDEGWDKTSTLIHCKDGDIEIGDNTI